MSLQLKWKLLSKDKKSQVPGCLCKLSTATMEIIRRFLKN
jgi:hypothetical protein